MSKKMPNRLVDRIQKRVAARRFTTQETISFFAHPNYALLAGAKIGYMMAVRELKEKISKL